MIQFGRKKPGRPPAVARRTSVSFTADELAALGQLLAAGQVVLQPERRLPVIARLKAAMTRLGVPVPKGL
jgi:hypothetical protein